MDLLGIVVVGLLSAGMLAVGLVTGYVRGHRRGRQVQPARHDADLDIIAGVGRSILSAQLRLEALVEIVYQQATKIVDTRNFQLGLFDGDNYLIKVWVREGERLPESSFVGHGELGLVGYVRKTAQPVRIGDYKREWNALPARPSYDAEKPPVSALFCPLIAGGEVIGVIAAQSNEADAFSEEALRLLTVLANQAAGAIRNAQLFTQARDQAARLRVLNEFSRQITAVQPLPNLLRQIVMLIHTTFRYYAVNIFLMDDKGDEIKLRASSHEAFEKKTLTLKPGDGLVGWSFSHAQTVKVSDVSSDERYKPVAVLDQTRSEVCVPLAVEKRVFGVLDVQSNELRSLKADDVATLEALAGQLSLALQEAKTYDSARRQAERVNAMADASRAVVSILDINDLLDEVVDLVADYFGYDRVHLFLRAGDRVVFRSGSGTHSARWVIEQLSYDINDKGFIPWVARTGQSLVSGEVQVDERYATGPGLEDSRSEMTVPIMMNRRVLGVFDIQSTDPDAFRPEDVTLVQALADTVAIGLRNAGLFATETRRRLLAETLREVSTVLVSSLDLESVLDSLLLSLERVVDYEAALILLRREDERDYVVRAVRGMVNEKEVLGQTLPILESEPANEHLIERMWDLLRQMETPWPEPGQNIGRDKLYAPMHVGGKEIGILAIERIGPDQFSSEDIEIINTFANQAALAIEGAQLFASQQEEAWVTTALLSVAESVNSTLELNETLATLVRVTPMLVGVTRCAIMAWDAETRHFVGKSIWGVSDSAEAAFKTLSLRPTDWTVIDALTSTTEPVTAGESTTAALPDLLKRLFEVSMLIFLPLNAKGALVGAMIVDRPPPGEPINQKRRMNILTGIAHQAAMALETGHLQEEAHARQEFERELEVAQRIQRSFLPRQLPRMPGWELEAFYRSARQVGGDFYDLIPLRHGKWAIVIADVADKGVPAALFMALCRTNIRAAAFSRDDPVETLVRVNRLLLSDSQSDMFVTAWYGVWDPTSGEITYANTGHNPPLLIQANGACSELTAQGIALGVIEQMVLEKRTLILEPGDVMVAYTDGVTDALRGDGAEFGLVGLQSTALAQHQRSAAEILQGVVQAIDTFSGDEPQFDDVTMVILKRRAADTP